MRPVAALVLAVLALAATPWGPADAAVVQPGFARYSAPASLASADAAAGPSVGVDWVSGAVLMQAQTRTYRVLFDDTQHPPVATWTDATPPLALPNLGAVAFVDAKMGRTFAGGHSAGCGLLAMSDDAGATWRRMGNACAGASIDHPTIGAGPWTGARPLGALWQHAIYYCAHNNGLAECAPSYDGGTTFRAPVPVACGVPTPGFSGSVEVAPDGTAYLPFRTCGAVNGVAVSRDHGVRWTAAPIPTATAPPTGFDPDVATTSGGWAYVAYPTATWGVGVALTKDRGATWMDFGDVARSAGVRVATFHEMVAGDDERAAVVFLGSPVGGDPHARGFLGTWSLYASTTYDAGQTWTTAKLTDDIVQRGWICADGFGCEDGRNLLDSIDAHLDSHGRLVVAYADGCGKACEANLAPSEGAWATLVRQTSGSGLFGVFDPIGVWPPDAPRVEAVSGDLRVDLHWAPPAEHGAPVTGYRVYRDGGVYRTLPTILSFGDTNVEDGRTYTYEVTALSAAGESERSTAIEVLVHLVTPPSEPAWLTAQHRGGMGSGRILLEWGAPMSDGHSPVTGFRVYRGLAPGQETLRAEVGYVDRYTDTDFTRGLTYYYRVSALNAKGEGPLSAEASAIA